MSENLNKHFKENAKSIYHVSKKTGIPYTTLAELINKKTDINKCAAITVFKLSLYFKCSVEDLLNKESLVANTSGTYRKIKYKWEIKQNPRITYLHIWDNKKEKIIDKGEYSQARFYYDYELLTEAIIDAYLVEKEAKEMLGDQVPYNA